MTKSGTKSEGVMGKAPKTRLFLFLLSVFCATTTVLWLFFYAQSQYHISIAVAVIAVVAILHIARNYCRGVCRFIERLAVRKDATDKSKTPGYSLFLGDSIYSKSWKGFWGDFSISNVLYRIAFIIPLIAGLGATCFFAAHYFGNYLFSVNNLLLNWDVVGESAYYISMILVIISAVFAGLDAFYGFATVWAKFLAAAEMVFASKAGGFKDIFAKILSVGTANNTGGKRISKDLTLKILAKSFCYALSIAGVAWLFAVGYQLIAQIYLGGLAMLGGSELVNFDIFNYFTLTNYISVPLIGIMLLLLFAKISDIMNLCSRVADCLYDCGDFICNICDKSAARLWIGLGKFLSTSLLFSPAIGVLFEIDLAVVPIWAWIILWGVGALGYIACCINQGISWKGAFVGISLPAIEIIDMLFFGIASKIAAAATGAPCAAEVANEGMQPDVMLSQEGPATSQEGGRL